MKPKRLYQFIGVAGFIFILYRIDISRIWGELKEAQIGLLFSVGLLSCLVQMMKSLRWNALLRLNGISCSILSTLRIYFIGTFMGAFTPARVGDLSRVYFIKKYHAPERVAGQIFANVFVDRFFDLALVACMALIGIPVLFKIWFREMALISVFVIGLCWVMYSFRHKIIDQVKPFLKPADGLSNEISWTSHFDEAINGLRMLRTNRVVVPVLLNVLAYGIFFFALRLMANSLRMEIPFWYLAVSMSAAMILTFLPVSIAGLGTRDAVLIFFFSFLEIKDETIVGFSILYLFFFLLLPSLMGAVPYFLLSAAHKEMLIKKTDADLK